MFGADALATVPFASLADDPIVLPRPSQNVRAGIRRRRAKAIHIGKATEHPDPPVYTIPFIEPRVVYGRERNRRGPVRFIGTALEHAPQKFMEPALLRAQVVRGLRRKRRDAFKHIVSRLTEITRRYATHRGLFRIFNTTEYRFYRSNSTPPEEGDTPFATSSSLPHTPADTFADGTWYLSVSYFNGVIDSGFLPVGPDGETCLRVDISGGGQTNAPPDGPLEWRLEARAGGVVCVIGLYMQPGTERAGEWAIAYTVDGSTPPEDTPDVTQTIAARGLVPLTYDLPAQADGTTVKVRLQTRRNDGTWVYSENSVVKTLAADAQGPTAPLAVEAWHGRLPEDV